MGRAYDGEPKLRRRLLFLYPAHDYVEKGGRTKLDNDHLEVYNSVEDLYRSQEIVSQRCATRTCLRS